MNSKPARLPLAVLMGIACISSAALADDTSTYRTFTLTWTPPSENEDGTPLTDLQGYYIYVGDTPDALLPLYYTVADSPRIVLGYGGPGLRYFAVSAVNVDGVESVRSGTLSEPLQ
jgi:hypothetical protein